MTDCGSETNSTPAATPSPLRHYSCGDVNKCPLTPNREPTTDQSKDTTEVQLGELMSFIEVTYRYVGQELLTGAELTPRQLITKAHPSMVTAHRAGNLQRTAQSAGGLVGGCSSRISSGPPRPSSQHTGDVFAPHGKRAGNKRQRQETEEEGEGEGNRGRRRSYLS